MDNITIYVHVFGFILGICLASLNSFSSHSFLSLMSACSKANSAAAPAHMLLICRLCSRRLKEINSVTVYSLVDWYTCPRPTKRACQCRGWIKTKEQLNKHFIFIVKSIKFVIVQHIPARKS